MSDTSGTTQFALVMTDDGELVNNTIHTTRQERRDTCVRVLKEACPYVKEAKVTEILETFGGADPDAAVGSISELYSEHGVDIYLENQPLPVDPAINPGLPLLHSVFISYGDDESAANSIAHFTDNAERLEYLYQRLNNLGAAAVLPLSEDDLAEQLQKTLRNLINDQVTVFLVSSDWIA
jgi:hypothetical protein